MRLNVVREQCKIIVCLKAMQVQISLISKYNVLTQAKQLSTEMKEKESNSLFLVEI